MVKGELQRMCSAVGILANVKRTQGVTRFRRRWLIEQMDLVTIDRDRERVVKRRYCQRSVQLKRECGSAGRDSDILTQGCHLWRLVLSSSKPYPIRTSERKN